MTGWVLGDAGSDRASTISTFMKFNTFLLAGWLVRLSSWLLIRAGGGLEDVPEVDSSATSCVITFMAWPVWSMRSHQI